MKIRKTARGLLLCCVVVSLFGCGVKKDTGVSEEKNTGRKTLTVLNYGEYIDRNVLTEFEKETGIKVLYEEATTPEEMYAKYNTGAIHYDVVCSSDYMVERFIREGKAQKLDFSLWKYKNNIDSRYFKLSRTFDPKNRYSVPYFWGTVGILYDQSKVKGKIDSWKSLFDGSYAGSIMMQNSIRDAYMTALKYKGYSLNTTKTEEILEAQSLLLAQKGDVEAYFVDEISEEMISGNATVAVCYSGEAGVASEYNKNLRYVVPKEGSNLWIDSWLITRKCQHPKWANRFLDFLCRKDIAMKNFEEIYYATPNKAVYNSLSKEEKTNPILFPKEDIMKKSEVYRTLDEKITEFYGKLWKELKVK